MDAEHNPLDERKEQILREIVEAYVRRGEPVGSKAVADLTLEKLILKEAAAGNF